MDIDHLRTLYPTLTEDEFDEAKEHLERYFACALRVATQDNPSYIDKFEDPPTIKERSLSSLTDITFEHG
jgi:hypothetical protein